MKVEFIDDNKLVVYYSLIMDDISNYSTEDIKAFIKLIVVKLKKQYNLELNGYYYLDVYLNKIMILEFELIDDYDDEIDLNIKIYLNSDIFVSFEDYFLFDGDKYFYNNMFYIDIDSVDFSDNIEFISFIYDDEVKNVKNKGIKL